MASISPSGLARELAGECLRGGTYSSATAGALIDLALSGNPETAREASRELFSYVVERLADEFEPRLCGVYAELFSEALSRAIPALDAASLLERYRRVSAPRRFHGEAARVRDVFVLSRVTLGADVAVTSQALEAARQRFPEARVWFVGPGKNFELFAGARWPRHLAVSYGRGGTLRERLAVWPALREALGAPDAVVIDPDSRLTQLGLLPVCGEENYYFFESRSYGGDGGEPLVELARRWLAETFSTEGVSPWIAVPEPAPAAMITVSLGVGGNPAKRLEDPFEPELLRMLASSGRSVLVDKGGSEEEGRRVERAIAACGRDGDRVRAWQGSFASFAGAIAASTLYVGYDSAGQHVAAATATPLVTVFSGFPNERMLARWRPTGPGRIAVVPVRAGEAGDALERARRAVDDEMSAPAVRRQD